VSDELDWNSGIIREYRAKVYREGMDLELSMDCFMKLAGADPESSSFRPRDLHPLANFVIDIANGMQLQVMSKLSGTRFDDLFPA